MVGGYSTVALSTPLSCLMAWKADRAPAPPTIRKSSRPACSMARSAPTPWSSSWFHSASNFDWAWSSWAILAWPDSTVNSAAWRATFLMFG